PESGENSERVREAAIQRARWRMQSQRASRTRAVAKFLASPDSLPSCVHWLSSSLVRQRPFRVHLSATTYAIQLASASPTSFARNTPLPPPFPSYPSQYTID